MNEKKTVLIVDDDPIILNILKDKLHVKLKNINIIAVLSYKEAVKHILDKSKTISVAVLDLNLPEVENCAIVEYALKKNIPSIVLTVSVNQNLKAILLKNKVLEYIVKDGRKGIDAAIARVERELQNQDRFILLVDDSAVQLAITIKILKKMHLKNIVTASNGMEAYGILLNSEKTFSMVITDYNMPKMDGMDLTLKIREKFDKDELCVIVLSGDEKQKLSSQFISMGANDFLNKPYCESDLITRINSNLELINLFEKIKDMANRDFLTGAYNRRYFYESAENIVQKIQNKKNNISIVMLDIDKFKNINDTYGHSIGDVVITRVVHILNENLRSNDLMARFGGEEFCILLENISIEEVKELFENVRKIFEETRMKIDEFSVQFTISIGIFYGFENTLEKMIKKSDDSLYFCKNNGRNQIAINKV